MRYQKKWRVTAALLAAALAASCVTGCSGGQENAETAGNTEAEGSKGTEGAGTAESGSSQSAETETRDSVVVVMGPTSEPEAGFDPAYGWGAGEHVHEPLIQSTLTVTTPDLKIGYDLAEDVQASEDGLTWQVKIRDDVRFTDGEPLTAEDVAFTYNTLKDTSSVNDFTMLKEAVAVDDTTVEFHMNRPYSIWPYTMAITGIVPEHAYGPDYGQKPIGSGRYILKQWDKGQQVIFEANPDYYGEAPRMKKVTVLFMEEDEAVAREYMIPQEDLKRLVSSLGGQYGTGIRASDPERERKPRKEKEDGIRRSQRLLLTWLIEKPELFDKIEGIIGPEDFSDGLYKEAAAMVFEEHKKGNMNPAQILNHFIEGEEQYREVAALFHASLSESLNNEEQKKAFSETVKKIKKNSLEIQSRKATDITQLQKIIKMQSELASLQISLD